MLTLYTFTSLPTQLWDSHLPTNTESPVQIPKMCWTVRWEWSLPWSVVELSVITKLNKADSLCQQLPNANSSLAPGVISCPPSLSHAGLVSGLSLLSSCVCWQDWRVYLSLHLPVVSGQGSFLGVLQHLWASESSQPLLRGSPWAFREECDAHAPFGAEHLLVSHSLHVDQLRVSRWIVFLQGETSLMMLERCFVQRVFINKEHLEGPWCVTQVIILNWYRYFLKWHKYEPWYCMK